MAFELCERWMAAQTRPPDRWTVIDDVRTPTRTTMGQHVIRREPYWEPGQRTLKANLQVALEQVQGDVIVIVEDDDYYSPEWLSAVSEFFTYNPGVKLYGEGWTIYYNLRNQKWVRNSNNRHASLCATAFHRDLVPNILQLLSVTPDGDPFVDHLIWAAFNSWGRLVDTDHVIGIKGLPGRQGIGVGHSRQASNSWPTYDSGHNHLRTLVGPEATEIYQCVKFPPEPPSNAMPSNMIMAGQCSQS